MPHGGVHQPGGKGLAIVKGDNVKILRGPRQLAQAAGCAALALGLASSAVATSSVANAAVAGPARTCCTFPKQAVAVSWGANQYGQLGNGTYVQYAVYSNVDNLTGVTQVAAGWNHSLALTSAGTVWAWGADNAGQLGNGSTTGSPEPEQVPGLTGVTQIAAGAAFSLALTSDGTVWAWGEDDLGQLGNGSTTGSDMPVPIAGLTGITQIGAGTEFGLALRSDGTVWAWGMNSSGQLGNATTTSSDVPVQVTGLSQVTQIAAGGAFAMAARTQGFVTTLTSVWTWGSNQFGALGDGETEAYRSTPGQVSGISVPSVRQIAAGAEYSMVLGSDGSVWAWGADYDGQLGNAATYAATTHPVETIGMASGITHIAAGVNHVLALRSDGTVLAWGNDQTSEIGNGTTSDVPALPTEVTGLTNATAVSAGGDFSLAVHTVYDL